MGSSFSVSRTWSPPWPYTTWMAAGSSRRAVSMTCLSSARPARGCSTLGSVDFIRLPWPAARITTETGEVRRGAGVGPGGDFLAIEISLTRPDDGIGCRGSPLDDHGVLGVLAGLGALLQ